MKRAATSLIDITDTKRPKYYRYLQDGSTKRVFQGPKKPRIVSKEPEDAYPVQLLSWVLYNYYDDQLPERFYEPFGVGDLCDYLATQEILATESSVTLMDISLETRNVIWEYEEKTNIINNREETYDNVLDMTKNEPCLEDWWCLKSGPNIYELIFQDCLQSLNIVKKIDILNDGTKIDKMDLWFEIAASLYVFQHAKLAKKIYQKHGELWSAHCKEMIQEQEEETVDAD